MGDGIGGGPDEHAVTAQPSTRPAAAQRPSRAVVPGLEGCLRCRTYGSLGVIGSTTVTANGAIRFEAKDPVSLTPGPGREISKRDLYHLGVVFSGTS